jgi:elongation factor G
MYFDGAKGETIRETDIPAELQEEANEWRQEMLESLAMYSDELMERLLSEEEISEKLIHDVTRRAVQGQDCTPVFLGTDLKNKCVQP